MSRRLSSGSVDRQSRGSIYKKRSGRSLDKVSQKSVEPTSDEIARGIMGEIVEKAMDKIQENYMEMQTIKFVVHCAHQALSKVMRIHFYQHNDYERPFETWGSETRVVPSYPDSWAINQIPLHRHVAEESPLNTFSKIKLDMEEQGEEIELDEAVDEPIQPSESLLLDIKALLNDIIDELPLTDEEDQQELGSLTSEFTKVATGETDYRELKMKTNRSKLALGTSTFRLPRLDVRRSGISRKQTTSSTSAMALPEGLPPIRTEAKYRCRRLTAVGPPEGLKPKKK